MMTPAEIARCNAAAVRMNIHAMQRVLANPLHTSVPAQILDLAGQYNRWLAAQEGVLSCSEQPGFNNWECCDVHRGLKTERNTLQSLGQKVEERHPNVLELAGKANRFSINWWASAGILRYSGAYGYPDVLYQIGNDDPLGLPLS